jgi:hypothetical protein
MRQGWLPAEPRGISWAPGRIIQLNSQSPTEGRPAGERMTLCWEAITLSTAVAVKITVQTHLP